MFNRPIIRKIQSVYLDLTTVEKEIADFFIHNTQVVSLSGKNISQLLYVSEASLSRFAKKCGFSGFREFVYNYKKEFDKASGGASELTAYITDLYSGILNKFTAKITEEQLSEVFRLFSEKDKVYVYGIGSSGLAAKEFAARFVRMGYYVEAVTDYDLIKLQSSLVSQRAFVLAFSLSASTDVVMDAMDRASDRGADTLLVTAHEYYANDKKEIILPDMVMMHEGSMISPQFPFLVFTDIVFSYFWKQLGVDKVRQYEDAVLTVQDKTKNK
ncbi:MAG: MurR/RpiR family transcriptional regulator [Lachnospiraceae bacterium]